MASPRLRLFLILLGLIFIAGALLALAYAYWPVEASREGLRLAPTLFAPP